MTVININGSSRRKDPKQGGSLTIREIRRQFELRLRLAADVFDDSLLHKQIADAGLLLNQAIKTNNKILIFGNGGSAAEAQHFAAELVCMFEKKRRAIPAIALTTDSSILTAQSNDMGFYSVFSRQIDALCQAGDVVVGLTTSGVSSDGHSQNIYSAFGTAIAKRAKTIGLFSARAESLKNLVDVAIIVPSENTALIQEVHLAIIHILCGQIESSL